MAYIRWRTKYIESVIASICSLSEVVKNNKTYEMQYNVFSEIVRLEQATTTFMDYTGFDSEYPTMAKKFRERLLNINGQLIECAEKIQSQNGVNFNEITTALKLETETLKEEIRLS